MFNQSKKTKTATIILFVALFLFPSSSWAAKFNIENPIGSNSFIDLINNIAKWIIEIAIPIAVVVIIYGGFIFLTAAGNPKKVDKGKKILTYAVIGLAIIFIGKGFISLIKSILELGN